MDEKAPLTPREREILKLVAAGYSQVEVSCRLGIARNTVHRHMFMISRKWNMHNAIQIVIYALKAGMLKLDEIELP